MFCFPYHCNLVRTDNWSLTEQLTVVITQWANNWKISDNEGNIKQDCSGANRKIQQLSKRTDSTVACIKAPSPQELPITLYTHLLIYFINQKKI